MAHPYEDQEATGLWKLLDRSIEELEANSDITLQTDRRYVVGYLCQRLTERGYDHASPDEAGTEPTGKPAGAAGWEDEA